MNILNKLSDFVNDNELVIHIYKGKINIVNYVEIEHFSNNKVTIKHYKGTITVSGQKLVVSKLIDNEVLIHGEIKQIELG